MAEPSLKIVGHESSVHYAYAWADGIQVLGPDLGRFGGLSTDSIRFVLQLLRAFGDILEFGADEGMTGYLGLCLKPILEELASNPRAQ